MKKIVVLLLALFIAVGITATFAGTDTSNGATAHPSIDPNALYLPAGHPAITLPAGHEGVTVVNLPEGHPAVPVTLPAGHPALNLPPCHPAIPTSCAPVTDPCIEEPECSPCTDSEPPECSPCTDLT